jgi:hypothetical protein
MNSSGAYVASAATVSAPFDLIAAGTSATTVGSPLEALAVPELAVPVDDVVAGALDVPALDDELLLLLLPHPTTATALTIATTAPNQFLRLDI